MRTFFGFVLVLLCLVLAENEPVLAVLFSTLGGYVMGRDW